MIVRKIAHYFVALGDILSSSSRGRLGRNLDQVSKNSDGYLPYADREMPRRVFGSPPVLYSQIVLGQLRDLIAMSTCDQPRVEVICI